MYVASLKYFHGDGCRNTKGIWSLQLSRRTLERVQWRTARGELDTERKIEGKGPVQPGEEKTQGTLITMPTKW